MVLIKNWFLKLKVDIKNFKPVEPYKAKGIKEKGQFVLRKEGKKEIMKNLKILKRKLEIENLKM